MKYTNHHDKEHNKNIFLSSSDETLEFVQRVRQRFSHQPQTFYEFQRILSRLNCSPQEQQLEKIAEIASLFSGHRDLFTTFLRFLPNGYDAELQTDSILLHVNEPLDGDARGDIFPVTYDLSSDKNAKFIAEAKNYRDCVKDECSPLVYEQFCASFRERFSKKGEQPQEILARVTVVLHGHDALLQQFQKLFASALSSNGGGRQGLVNKLNRCLYEVKDTSSSSQHCEPLYIMIDDDFISKGELL